MTQTKTNIRKKELFEKALKAADQYNRAVEVGATIFQELFHLISQDFYNEIVANGWEQEYQDFVLMGGEM